jgi:Zn-dependent protease with chaperone function
MSARFAMKVRRSVRNTWTWKGSILASKIHPTMSVEGLWRPPAISRAKAALMTVGVDGTATIKDKDSGTVFASAPFKSVEISDRVGSIPRHITFPDQSVFETSDNDTVDNIVRPYARRHFGIIHSLERFHPRLVIFAALVIAFCFALYRFALPILVEVAIAVTPPVVPQLLSKSVLASLDQAIFEETKLSSESRKDLSDQFAKIATLTPRGMAALAPADTRAYTLNFRRGGAIGPNAFALPDGTVVLTDELVELANDDEMVLAVLAHEIGHVDHEHSLRQLYRAAGVTALIMLIGGDIGSATEDILIQGSALVSLSYSRSAEAEADRYSVELMHKAGRDPAAIARFFELMRDRLGDNSENDFLSTHPATPERIAETRRYAEEIATRKN